MTTLALLSDGSCSIKGECLADSNAVAARCPQLEKCGSCVMWSVRGNAPTGRNIGVCLLENDARRTLDCNAPGCPYYRPRRDSPAAAQARHPGVARARSTRRARKPLGREAPAPTAAALAMKAMEGADGGAVAELVQEVLSGGGTLPALLERFRGGTAVLKRADGVPATVPVERWYLWLCQVKQALDALDKAIASSALGDEDREKISKDIKGMRGSMTTFNVLFRDKEDHFVGQKGA